MKPCTASICNQTHSMVDIGVLQVADNEVHDSPDGLFAIMLKQGGAETMYYVHKDYLGSITAITNASGNLLESLSYDPWGRRRKATDWTDYNVTSTLFDRGFTGHEHLDHFGLINMNGRVYDPFLARFLSPDPFVQAPSYTQNYNRYSYAWNNPLKYTDPSGEWVHIAFGAAIGGIANLAMNWGKVGNLGQGLGYFFIGAGAGALSAGIGAGFGTLVAGSGSFGFMSATGLTAAGFLPGAAAGAGAGFTSGFVTGTGNSLMQGEKLKQSLGKGLQSGAWGLAIGGLTGGIQGGIRAHRFGNDFWSGNSRSKSPEIGRVDVLRNDALGDITTNSAKSPLEMYIDSEMAFDGDYLYFIDNYSNLTSRLRDSWSAVSGPYGNGALPNGNYIADNLRIRTGASMVLDGVGFSVDLNPLFETQRTLLRIHPDGGVLGTLGCIGIQENAAGLNNFFSILNRYFNRNSTSIRLIVY